MLHRRGRVDGLAHARVSARRNCADSAQHAHGRDLAAGVSRSASAVPRRGTAWLLAGILLQRRGCALRLDRQLYVLGGGVRRIRPAAARRSRGCSLAARTADALYASCNDLHDMPRTMRRLAVGAVLVLVRAVRDVDLHDLCGDEPPLRHDGRESAAFNEGANWVGVLFAPTTASRRSRRSSSR